MLFKYTVHWKYVTTFIVQLRKKDEIHSFILDNENLWEIKPSELACLKSLSNIAQTPHNIYTRVFNSYEYVVH